MLVFAIFMGLLFLGDASAQANTKSCITYLTKQGLQSTAPVKTVSKVLTLPFYVWKVTTTTP